MWVCSNGHDVRDGAFVCPRCGSDAVADPDRIFDLDRTSAPGPTTGRQTVRVAARAELSNRLAAGVVLVLAGLFCIALAAGAASDGDAGWFAGALVALGYLVGAVGAAFLLVAIIGHGVRLGIETSRSEASD